MITVITPAPNESRYKLKLEFNGISADCDLTYSNDSNVRNMVLVSGRSNLGSAIIADKRLQDIFADVLKYIPSVNDIPGIAPKGKMMETKINAIKELVTRIHSCGMGELSFAIHKFGYVPVIPINFGHPEYTIGVYPQERSEFSIIRKSMGYPAGIKNDHEFLACLQITPYKLYRKYLEDIGEYFHLIEHSNNIADIYRYCKDIEELRGESLDSKLNKVLVKKPHNQHAEKLRLIKELKETPAFFMARFGRELSMLIVNEIYGIIGLSPKVEIYHKRLYELGLEYKRNAHLPDWSVVKDVEVLIRLLGVYHKMLVKENFDFGNELEKIRSSAGKQGWIRRFGHALLFIAMAKQENKKSFRRIPGQFDATVPKIFVSHQHDAATAENLLKTIQKYAEQDAVYNSAAILKINEKRTDFDPNENFHEQFKRVGRCMIWLSDKVYVILSSEIIPGKDLKWLIREMEHTILVNNEEDGSILYLKEVGFDDALVKRDFEALGFDFLSLEYRKPNDLRIATVKNQYEASKPIAFKHKQDILPGPIQDTLIRDYNDVPITKTVDILKGYLTQFDSASNTFNHYLKHSLAIILLDELCDKPMSTSEIADRLYLTYNKVSVSDLEALVTRLAGAMSKRKLGDTSGAEIDVLKISGTTNNLRLKGNMLEAIKKMLPNSSDIERRDIRRMIAEYFKDS